MILYFAISRFLDIYGWFCDTPRLVEICKKPSETISIFWRVA